MIIRQFLLLLLLLTNVYLHANDGAYFASGNQLIPIHETDISVQKEILKVKKVNNQFIEVTVYYEFFNPAEAKEILVGFEAVSPFGDVDGAPKKGLHPYMRDFTVNMNGENLKYNVAYVADSLYYQNGKIKSIDLKTFDGSTSGNYIDFMYVYHFKAKFKKGKNIVKHTYKFDVSGSIDYNYHFNYILTAANRWANKQIDDFTLIVEMEDFEEFNINKTFFKSKDEWQIEGKGKVSEIEGKANTAMEKDALRFQMQEGRLVFKRKNFHPEGELEIYSFNKHVQSMENKDYRFYLPFSVYMSKGFDLEKPATPFHSEIMNTLPFARRGYVFKDNKFNYKT